MKSTQGAEDHAFADDLDVRRRLVEPVEELRLQLSRSLDPVRRAEMGQYLTPSNTARLMGSYFENESLNLRLIDAGAGIGSLVAAFVAEVCSRAHRPHRLTVVAYEIEPAFIEHLRATLSACATECERASIEMVWEARNCDFVAAAVELLCDPLFKGHAEQFTSAILNPPYRKINGNSEWRRLLGSVGIETGNLYSAFLALTVRMLKPGGELVAISPRSFCNGPYFRHFRRSFLQLMALRRLHVFESRHRAFRDDEVLQENLIFHALKGADRHRKVVVALSRDADDENIIARPIKYENVVRPDDPDAFIQIVPDDFGDQVASDMRRLRSSLPELRLAVSTGRVVDFRASEHLRKRPGNGTVPLIYPTHLRNGFVEWPLSPSRKCEAIKMSPATSELLVPLGWYVVVKRFSAKEERRRLTAAVLDPARVKATELGFENHLNFYHRAGKGIPQNLAKGIAAFLNSSLVDSYFRQFSGHTQVNATDLRKLPYPSVTALEQLGKQIGTVFPEQKELDLLVEKSLA
jgi:adenine-specific DNA-methyltransferase